jgi:glycosyltransferase involved in cell wall biosynthesis
MRILILEPYASGHHASYLRWLVQAAVRMHWSVVIATSAGSLTHPSLRTIAADFGDVHTHVIKDLPMVGGATIRRSLLMLQEFAYWRTFRRTLMEVRKNGPIDGAILPYVDYCFYALAILGSPFKELPWCGISMRLKVGQSSDKQKLPLPLKWRLANRVLRSSTLRALFVINPSVQDVPSYWCSKTLLSKVQYLPDPAEYEIAGSRRESRTALGISDKEVAILVFGLIDERKGIDSLLSSLSLRDGLESYVVILAGTQSAYIRGELRKGPFAKLVSCKRLIVIDRVLAAAEQNLVFTAADVVWVGYRNHAHMSGVLVLAGRAGLPVVGTREGEIGRLIEKYGVGIAAGIDQPAEVDVALRAMLDFRTRTEMGRKAQCAFAGHTVENFGARVMAAFSAASGID